MNAPVFVPNVNAAAFVPSFGVPPPPIPTASVAQTPQEPQRSPKKEVAESSPGNIFFFPRLISFFGYVKNPIVFSLHEYEYVLCNEDQLCREFKYAFRIILFQFETSRKVLSTLKQVLRLPLLETKMRKKRNNNNAWPRRRTVGRIIPEPELQQPLLMMKREAPTHLFRPLSQEQRSSPKPRKLWWRRRSTSMLFSSVTLVRVWICRYRNY